MNVRYLCAGDVVWTPAEHTGAVFHALVSMYETRTDSRSGIDLHGDGEVSIDPLALAPFAQAVVDDWETVGSAAFHLLVDGFLGALQVICERCGIGLEVSDGLYALAVSMRHNM